MNNPVQRAFLLNLRKPLSKPKKLSTSLSQPRILRIAPGFGPWAALRDIRRRAQWRPRSCQGTVSVSRGVGWRATEEEPRDGFSTTIDCKSPLIPLL